MTMRFTTETEAKAYIPTARAVLECPQSTRIEPEQFVLFGKDYGYTLAIYSPRGNFDGYY